MSQHSSLSFSHYLFSGVVSFSLLAGASCRSGRLAKSSCSARPIARDRTTIFPSLDTQTNQTSQHHTCRHTGTGTHVQTHTYSQQCNRPNGNKATRTTHTHTHTFHVQRESGRERGHSQHFLLHCIST